LSLVLLTGAGLLTRSLRNLESQPYGFETEGRLMVRVNQAFSGYSPERLYQVYQRLRQRLAEVPGVRSASFSLYSPMRGTNWDSNISFEGRPSPAGRDDRAYASWDRVSPRYFETIGTHLLRGRVIDERDTPNSRRVTVINEAFARKYFPNEDPMGKRFGMETSADYEIVGIIEDAKYTNAREPAWPMFFLPYLQMTPADWANSTQARSNYIQDIQLRIGNSGKAMDHRIRQALADVDANLTVLRVQSFDEQVRGNFQRERLIARLTGLFGLLALVLACVGLYGITAYSVARRTSEIGIRTALGATRGNVIKMVLRGALVQIGCGVAIGIPVAIGGGRLLASQLYGIKNYDPLVLGGATLTLLGCAFIAGFLPARRATAIDPIQALRTE
jgi:predicted permease